MFLCSGVMVVVLMTHDRLGLAVAGRCGLSVDIFQADGGVCCSNEDYGTCTRASTAQALAVLRLGCHEG